LKDLDNGLRRNDAQGLCCWFEELNITALTLAVGEGENPVAPGVNAGELRTQLFSLSPASGERVGVRGLSDRIFLHPDPLPEGEGTLIHQH